MTRTKGGDCFRQLVPILLWLITSGVVVWVLLFHPNLVGCQQETSAVALPTHETCEGWISPDKAEALQKENEQLNLQLKEAKGALVMLEKSLSAAQSKISNSQVLLDRTLEMLPLEANSTCGAPSIQREHHNNDVYCADPPLHMGRTKDFAECQLACQYNSSCEFYSYWKTGRRSRLCRITASCEKLESVADKNEKVRIQQRIVPATSQWTSMQLLGMYDSGTNLMLGTLVSNFPLCCQQARRPDIAEMQVPASSHGRCLSWTAAEKHVNPLGLLGALRGNKTKHFDPQLWDFLQKRQTVTVAMVRDPLAQLQSWRKAPYGMERCAKRRRCPFATPTPNCVAKTAWITEPCQFFETGTAAVGSGVTGGSFKSLPAIWNVYTEGYVRIVEESGYKHVLLVRFEDLVMDPKPTIDRISEAMEMPLEATAVNVVNSAAKAHGKAKNRSTEMRSLSSRDFMKDYSMPELRAACVRLNFSLAERVGYPLKECQTFKAEAMAEGADESHKQIVDEAAARFRSRRAKPRASKVLRERPRTMTHPIVGK